MRFGILGPLQAVGDDGLELALGGRMPRAVLALLLLRANEVVSADRLIDELWPEPPQNAANALQYHVSQLRKSLGPDSIVTRAFLPETSNDSLALVAADGGALLQWNVRF